MPDIIVSEDSTIVVSTLTGETTILTSQTQGPPGRDGTSGGSSVLVTAGTNLSGHIGVKLVSSNAFPITNSDLTTVNRLVGVTKTSATTNTPVELVLAGELDGFSGLIPDTVLYLQGNSTITSTYPTTGYVQQVGIAISSTKALINIQPPIILG